MIEKGIWSVVLLSVSNIFMTLAWYGHLALKKVSALNSLGLVVIILISWGFALFEYMFMIPANKMGYIENGGPFNLFQLKIIQEVISLIIFTAIALLIFKNESFKMNHLYAFLCILGAIYFVFKDQ